MKLQLEANVRALTENHAPPAEPAALPWKTEFDMLTEYLGQESNVSRQHYYAFLGYVYR